MDSNNKTENLKDNINYSTLESHNEPYYLLTLQDNNGMEHQIKVCQDSDPSKLAFDFCKKYDLDVDSMKYLKKNIKKILKNFELQIKKTNFLEGNNNPIQEVDEENFLFDSSKEQKNFYEKKTEKNSEEKLKKSNHDLTSKTVSSSQINQGNSSCRSHLSNMKQSEKIKKKTIPSVNNSIDFPKYIKMNNVNENINKGVISPMIENTLNKIAELTKNTNHKVKNDLNDSLLKKVYKKIIIDKNNINNHDNSNTFSSPNTINLFNNYNFIMKTEPPLITNGSTNFDNDSLNSNERYFTINYLENGTVYKRIPIKNLKLKKSIHSYFINKKNKNKHKINLKKNSINSNRNPNINLKSNFRKNKTDYLKSENILKDKTVNFNGTQIIETTVDLEKDTNNSIFKLGKIRNISPISPDKLVIYTPNYFKYNNNKVNKSKNASMIKLLRINKYKSKNQKLTLKSKTPKIPNNNKCYKNHVLVNSNNIDNITNKNNFDFSSKSYSGKIVNFMNNELSWINPNQFSKTIVMNKFNKKLDNTQLKNFNLKKSENKKITNINPFLDLVNINQKNSKLKSKIKLKLRTLYSENNSFIKKPRK